MWAAVWCSEGGGQQGDALLFGSIVGRLEGREQWAAGAVSSQWGKRACGLMWQQKGTRWQPSRERPSRDGAAPGYGQRVFCRHLYSVALTNDSPEEDSSSLPSEEHEPNIDLNLPRRRLQVSFTCDACGERSQRLINPHAYARGTVFVQCAGCEAYHKGLNALEEAIFNDRDNAPLKYPESDSFVT
ncbi:hypothetical protein L7F22_035989 [Adiantum nelumboides]|nr:hypothetical protein [Adiantum nelumboides]